MVGLAAILGIGLVCWLVSTFVLGGGGLPSARDSFGASPSHVQHAAWSIGQLGAAGLGVDAIGSSCGDSSSSC